MDLFPEATPRGVPNLQFDPDKYPHATLKAFNDFIEQYDFRYEAQYPEPAKHVLDSTVVKWKSEHEDADPSADQTVTIRNEIVSKDKVRKLLGFFATNRLQQDWKAAEPVAADRNSTWDNFLMKMRAYYKPTENSTLRNYEFRQLVQHPSETFSAFCNRTEKEGKTCTFCDCDATTNCNASEMAIRDQIVVGTHNEKIREQALLKSWSFEDLRKKGMKLESAARGEEKLSQTAVSKLGAYSYKNIEKKKQYRPASKDNRNTKSLCYRCGEPFHKQHIKNCRAVNAKCSICSKTGHFAKVCNSKDVKATDQSDSENDAAAEEEDTYSLNIWRIKSRGSNPKFSHENHDFRTRVMVNNKLVNLLVDTGAKVSVCGMKQAASWGILDRLQPSTAKIRPYQSEPIAVRGTCICAVTVHDRSVPVEFHVLPGSCEPILAGIKAQQLNLITFNGSVYHSSVFHPVLMIGTDTDTSTGKAFSEDIQNILQQYPQNFTGLGKLHRHQVKLYVDASVKPVAVPPRSVPYHLKVRVDEALEEMIREGVIEPHPVNEPAPWVSCAVIVPKADGSIRVTLDARNLNKAIQSTNLPIPRLEDIKAQLSGAKYFSKLDFKSAFWQLELHPDSRYLTVFYCNGRLYRYTRLLMGVKPAQGELNMALKPLFANIPDVYLIHDDLIIAAKSMGDHNRALSAVMEAIAKANITLNPSKCVFGKNKINFWGMIISAEGIRPDPAKVDALNDLSPPKNKDELKSFICMMQSNSEFIPDFSQRIAPLRELLQKNVHFKWKETHQKIFDDVLSAFGKDTLLRYFDLGQSTFIFVDAHISGLGAILAQGENIEEAKPIEFASRCTNRAERNYPQLDLEAMAVDFALRRFRQYLIGSPKPAVIVTDHHPLLSVFNGRRGGSIRTENIKMRHQNIRFQLAYQKGSKNSADFLSRHAKPWESLPKTIKEEANDLTNLLYTLRLSPIMDALGIHEIAKATAEDPCLSKLQKMIKDGKTFIPKEDLHLSQFRKIFHEITVLANGTLIKQDRIILPSCLHERAIQLAHAGAHPGQNGLLRRLRSHFYIPNLDHQVKKFVENCLACQTFTDKNTKEPIQPNKVPEKCWEEVSIDLFGPLPTSHHIVVVQDLASRFPIAKIVTSTSSNKVLPVIAEAYNTFGNPKVQKSDNGPPFNSKAMDEFTSKREIEQVKIAPGHPAANNVETIMKPLGKAMKIGFNNKMSEDVSLQTFLHSYRDTPHPSTGVSPGSMLFRDGYRYNLPRKCISADEATKAKELDIHTKNQRKVKYNSARHTKPSNFCIGDQVLVRNFHKQSKFEPLFLPERYFVIDTMANGKIILVKSSRTGRCLKRHPNDLKAYHGGFPDNASAEGFSEGDLIQAWREAFESLDNIHDHSDYISINDTTVHRDNITEGANTTEEPLPRRSSRTATQNTRYFNDDFVTD